MRQVDEEFEPRVAVFTFSHPAVSTAWGSDFEPMVNLAMTEYMAARASYHPFGDNAFDSAIDPQVAFTASNGVVVELDWPDKHQIRYPQHHSDEAIDCLLIDKAPEDQQEIMALIEEEERQIANAKPNPRKTA